MTDAPEATRRLFFAFWPEPGVRAELEHACRKAIRVCGGRPVAPADWHVTVAFLGSVPESRLAGIRSVAVGLPGRPLELVFDGIEFWPKPQVLVAGSARQPGAAAALAHRLWARLTPLGLVADRRPLRPHVTLARKVRKPPEGLSMRAVHWPVHDIALVQSVTDPAGARYEVLERWPLDSTPGSPVDPPHAPD